jgi:hypothetical protein
LVEDSILPAEDLKTSFPASRQPYFAILVRKDERHSGVNCPHKLIRLSRDDRAGVQAFVIRGIISAFPKPGKYEGRIVLHADRERNFTAENFLPFVETVTRD